METLRKLLDLEIGDTEMVRDVLFVRVPGGWISSMANLDEYGAPHGFTGSVFVPEIEFREKPKPADHRRTPHQEIVDLYHKILPGLPGIRMISEARKAEIRRLHQSDVMEEDLDNWRGYFEKVNRSDFLMGRNQGPVSREWRAGFDWLLKQKNAIGVLEGKYQ